MIDAPPPNDRTASLGDVRTKHRIGSAWQDLGVPTGFAIPMFRAATISCLDEAVRDHCRFDTLRRSHIMNRIRFDELEA
jgi:hypothetical protein